MLKPLGVFSDQIEFTVSFFYVHECYAHSVFPSFPGCLGDVLFFSVFASIIKDRNKIIDGEREDLKSVVPRETDRFGRMERRGWWTGGTGD